MPEFAEYMYIGHAMGFAAPLFGRVSFCLYMMRVLGSASSGRRITLRVFIGLQIVVNVAMTILVFTQCGRFDNLWKNGFAPTSKCVGAPVAESVVLSVVTLNSITDLYLTILPAQVVWKIRAMTARTKIGVSITLCVSIFASIASICKIYYVFVMYLAKSDSFLVFARLFVIMAVEINVVIIVASLPILAPLLSKRSGRGSSAQMAILPSFEAHVDASSRKGLMSLSSVTRPSLSLKKPFLIKHDSGLASPYSSFGSSIDNGPGLHVLMVKEVKIESTCMGHGMVMDRGSVPQSLEDSYERSIGSAKDGNVMMPPLTPWEEEPSLTFLRDGDESVHELRI
ncbi:hypothetical protein BDV97DRAFT_343511 [Delphinella strobiligena]|nr:hypothetical protein BDV97DRAFT_343511 [Delphinella strobiligena]